MSTERIALGLIGPIYDAAGDPARWPAFLEQLGGVFKSTASLLYFFDLQNQRANFSISIGFEPSFMRSHDEYYASKNIYKLRGGHLLQPGALCRSEALCPDSEALRSEFFNDWIVPQKQRYSINAVVLKDDARASILG